MPLPATDPALSATSAMPAASATPGPAPITAEPAAESPAVRRRRPGVKAKAATPPADQPAAQPAAKQATKRAKTRARTQAPGAVAKQAAKVAAPAVDAGAAAARGQGVRKPAKRPAVPAPVAEPRASAPAAPQAAEKPAEAAASKPARSKEKLVRDSFTMPRSDFALIAVLKDRALKLQRPAKKSELLRAGLQALQAMDDGALLGLLNRLPQLKTGRPKKADQA